MSARSLLAAVLLAAAPGLLPAQAVVKAPPASGNVVHYPANRPPLVAERLVRLPPGSVRPLGWLRYQCQALADGITGRLEEVSPFCKAEGNAWLDPSGRGHSPWEEVPYWLRGLTRLAYVLDDPHLKAKALSWLGPILKHQHADGWFGPLKNLENADLWPNMLVLEALRTHHEATGDPAVPEFMTRYFRFQSALDPRVFLYRSWQKVRGGDNLESIYWLYNRTGDKSLLPLAELNHRNTVDWVENVPTPHGVNIAQCFKEPAVFYQQSREPKHLASALMVYSWVQRFFGRVPGGMFGADEVFRRGFDGPRQCAETCTMMEYMSSHAFMARLSGDARWADRCEEVAFNSLPASFAPDLRSMRYLTAPNQPVSDRRNKSPMINNEGEMFSFRPDLYRCCMHNSGLGWSVYAEHLFAATRDGGLAALLYGPGEVRAKVGRRGLPVVLRERTGYPFRDTVTFEVVSGCPDAFPLYVRVPAWCEEASFLVNGRPAGVKAPAGGWVAFTRVFAAGDRVTARIPMRTQPAVLDDQRACFTVHRGPLAFSLMIGEDWKRGKGKGDWAGWEVFPSTPWNYSPLWTDFETVERDFKPNTQVFTQAGSPLVLRAKARRVPSWGLEKNGMVQEIGAAPMIAGTGPDEAVTLVPMGCARLRISVFPRLSNALP